MQSFLVSVYLYKRKPQKYIYHKYGYYRDSKASKDWRYNCFSNTNLGIYTNGEKSMLQYYQ